MYKTTFVTGVSSGWGHGMARHLLSTGSRVYGCSRRTPEDLQSEQGFVFESADFEYPEGMEALVDSLLSDVESLDLLVLNAGVLNEIKDMADTTVEEIEKVTRINVWSHKALLDAIFARGIRVGQVVGISSGASISGNRGWNAYSLSKATLNMMIRLYSEERPGTHFCAFAPGLVDTAMQEYVCGLPSDGRFPTVDRLKGARGTEVMPRPDEAGATMIEAFARLPQYPSGEFLDIRKI